MISEDIFQIWSTLAGWEESIKTKEKDLSE